MRKRGILQLLALAFVLISCDKDPAVTPPPAESKVLLKDIVIPNLPSPYYHFEYNAKGLFTKASYASGIRQYDVTYNGNSISELKSNSGVNQDRLEYVNNEAGLVDLIKYIDKTGKVYMICNFMYQDGRLRLVEWERKDNSGFIIERTMAFIYQADGNVLEITDHRLPVNGQTEATYVSRFEQYDNNVNVDGFSLLHIENYHLLLLSGVQLQKNNARKLTVSSATSGYTVDYTYTYNDKNAPLTKTGEVLITHGPNTGQRFQTNAALSYY